MIKKGYEFIGGGKKQLRSIFSRFLLVFFAPAVVSAGPRIAVDTPDFDIGVIYDVPAKTFQHTFRIKNTGDAPLVISDVRKTCSCTSVEFDSVIPPGRAGFLTEIVSTEDAHKGPFTMPVTVISDARNVPIFKLSIKGIFRWAIDVEPASLNITTPLGKDSTSALLSLRSNMKSLAVSGVTFVYTEKTQGFSWTSSFPLPYSFFPIKGKTVKSLSLVKTGMGNVAALGGLLFHSAPFQGANESYTLCAWLFTEVESIFYESFNLCSIVVRVNQKPVITAEEIT